MNKTIEPQEELVQSQPVSALKRAFLKIEELDRKLKDLQQGKRESIAIIGMACRFPGAANTLNEFWSNLVHGVDSISEVPPDRWSNQDFYSDRLGEAGKIASQEGGFIQTPYKFDSQFFGISPREADFMDPQHRIALEVVWEALENANIPPEELYGSNTGVFLGISTFDYYRQLATNLSATDISAYIGTGNSKSAAAGRISYCLGLIGPSVAIDTACSSSLVALESAIESLRQNKCDRAIVGGVNLMLCPSTSIAFSQSRMLAGDGRCKTFSAAADGYGRAEGCGVIILESLSKAQKMGRKIFAKVRGAAVNQDGASSGLTVPNGPAQQRVIQLALKDAGVQASDVSYVEAHGTGTPLGDPIEIGALNTVYSEGRLSDTPLYVGSLKTNIGHMEAAAGIGGVIKVALSFMHKKIPAHLHFDSGNSHVSWSTIPLRIPTETRDWFTSNGAPRIAGVSSFGFAGTNTHIIMEEYVLEECGDEQTKYNLDSTNSVPALTISAKSEEALFDLAQKYADQLVLNFSEDFLRVCKTSNLGRYHFPHRLCISANSNRQLADRLDLFSSERRASSGISYVAGGSSLAPKIAFVFTGQGSQYFSMGKELFESNAYFRDRIKQCSEYLDEYLEHSLVDVLFSDDYQANGKALVNDTAYTQPALFALEYSLARLLQHWGLKPGVLLGHSVGEYTAACLAGVFSLKDALMLIAHRGRLMQALPLGGKMLSISCGRELVNKLVEAHSDHAAVAAYNSPSQIVISGDAGAIENIKSHLDKEGIENIYLNVSHAFHSPLMSPMLDAFRKIADTVQYSTPSIPLISNLTGELIHDEIAYSDYWVKHISLAVNFEGSVHSLCREQANISLEIGPHPVLTRLLRENLATSNVASTLNPLTCLHTFRKGISSNESLSLALGELYVRGCDINWASVNEDNLHKMTQIPLYAFRKTDHHFRNTIDGNRIVQLVGQENPNTQLKNTDADSSALSSQYCYVRNWEKKALLDGAFGTESGEVCKHDIWIVLGQDTALSKRVMEDLRSSGATCFSVLDRIATGGDEFDLSHAYRGTKTDLAGALERIKQAALNANKDATSSFRVLYFSDFENGVQDRDLPNYVYERCVDFMHFVHAFTASMQDYDVSIWAVNQDNRSKTDDLDLNALLNAAEDSLAKSVYLEKPGLLKSRLHLSNEEIPIAATHVLQEVRSSTSDAVVSYFNGERFVERLTPLNIPSSMAPGALRDSHFRDDGIYLITGGLGALGLDTASWLIGQGVKNLVLCSRSKPNEFTEKLIESWTRKNINIRIVAGDIAEESFVNRLFNEIDQTGSELKGIVHAAGVVNDCVIDEMTVENIRTVFAPKVAGAWLLHKFTEERKLDFFIMYSSVASVLGSVAQGSYSAANGFLDALALYRRAKGLTCSAINWGPWEGAGMAEKLSDLAKIRLKNIGLNCLEKSLCHDVLSYVVKEQPAQIAVIDVDWLKFITALGQTSLTLLENIAPGSDRTQQLETIATTKYSDIKKLDSSERFRSIESFAKTMLAKILGHREESLKASDNFIHLGMDSLLLMELVGACKTQLGLTIYPREIYENPTLHSLTQYLHAEFEKQHFLKADVTTPQVKATKVPDVKVLYRKVEIQDRPKNVVFLLSSPRAGSTLFRSMLAGHSRLFSPPELHLLPYEDMADRAASLAGSYMDEGLVRAFMESRKLSPADASDFVHNFIADATRVVDVYRALQSDIGDRILIDKSPTYASSPLFLRRSEEIFTQAKYVHLVRHPYAVIESFSRMRMEKLIDRQGLDGFDIGEDIWETCNRNIQEFFRDHVDSQRHLTVMYEDLVSQPDKVMTRVCSFLGVEFQESLLTPYSEGRMNDGVHKSSLSIGDPNFLKREKIDSTFAESWKNIVLPRSLRPETVALSKQFNYHLANEHASVHTLKHERRVEYRRNYNNVDYCISQWGSTKDPIVFCIHGILDQGPVWERLALLLVEHGYCVIAPDLRGHGLSGHGAIESPTQLMDFVSDIKSCIAGLRDELNVSRVNVLAHSLGTVIASIYSACEPETVEQLWLIEPILPSETKTDILSEVKANLDQRMQVHASATFASLEEAEGRMAKFYPSMSDDLRRELCERVLKKDNGVYKWTWDPRLTNRAVLKFGHSRAKYLELLSKIRAPITVVQGSESDFNRTEDLADLNSSLTNAAFHSCSGGHGIVFENPTGLSHALLKTDILKRGGMGR
ncbi:MAG: alpha/beta fold hydrolase [Pseudomonadota bacterium]